MRGKRIDGGGRSRGRFGLVVLVVLTANALILEWRGVPAGFYQWAVVLGLEAVLLAISILLLSRGKSAREVPAQSGPCEDIELAMIKRRLSKYTDGGAELFPAANRDDGAPSSCDIAGQALRFPDQKS